MIMRSHSIKPKPLRVVILLFLLAGLAAGCSTLGGPPATASLDGAADAIEARWGVRPMAVRLTAAGHFIDFRFKVTDPEKAREALDRSHKAYLVEVESGAVMPVPMTKLGPLRGSAVMPKEGRQYVIIFENVQGRIQPGDRVSVVIGDFMASDLTVL